MNFWERMNITNDIHDALRHIFCWYNILKWSPFEPKEEFWELIVMELLNEIYDLNLRRTQYDKTNFEAIDLIDIELKLWFQVTVDVTTNKVSSTIKIFEEKKIYEFTSELCFFFISDLKSNLLFPKKTFSTNWLYTFNRTWLKTFNTLADKVWTIADLDKLRKIKEILYWYYKKIDGTKSKFWQKKCYEQEEIINRKDRQLQSIEQSIREIDSSTNKNEAFDDFYSKFTVEWWINP